MPTSRAIASAVARLSPVSIQTSSPSASSCATASRDSGLSVSATAIRPAACAVDGDVHRASRRPAPAPSARVRQRRRAATPARSISARLPSSDRRGPRPCARTPLPVIDWNASAGGRSSPSSRARATIASPSGCSEPTSAAAASRSRSAFGRGRRSATTAVTAGLPRVSVPVLSSTMVSILRACSSASPPRIRMPYSAALPVPTMIAVGVARPRAQGQAMISTAMAAWSAKVSRGSGPKTQPAERR